MEASELTTAAFWDSCQPWIAKTDAGSHSGLADFLAARFPDQSVCAFQTSGTESGPKWVLLEKRALLTSAEAVNHHFAVTATDRWLITLPIHHVGGFSIFARAFLSGSAVVHSLDKWNPVEFVDLVRTECITLTSLVPTQVYDLVQQRLPPPPSLRAIAVGGGGMNPALAESARDLGWPVFQSYGMTETASQIATQSLHRPADSTALEVLPIWDLTTDTDQRLTVKGPALALGYAVPSTSGQWTFDPIDAATGLRTRDHVRLWKGKGERCFLEFQGRDHDWVKILGELVHLPPLQSHLDELAASMGWPRPPVLIAIPDDRSDHRLVLVTEESQPTPDDLLLAYHNTLTSPIHRISDTRVIPIVPRSDLGKVRRTELLRCLADKSKKDILVAGLSEAGSRSVPPTCGTSAPPTTIKANLPLDSPHLIDTDSDSSLA